MNKLPKSTFSTNVIDCRNYSVKSVAWAAISGVVLGLAVSVGGMNIAIGTLVLIAAVVFLVGSLDGFSLYVVTWLTVLVAYMWEFGTFPDRIVGALVLFSFSFALGTGVSSFPAWVSSIKEKDQAHVGTEWVVALYLILSVATVLMMLRVVILLPIVGIQSLFITWDWRTISAGVPNLNRGLLGYSPILAYLSLAMSVALRRFDVRIPTWASLWSVALLVLSMLTSLSARRNFLFEASATATFIYLWQSQGTRQLLGKSAVALVAIAIIAAFGWSQSLLGKSLGTARADVLSYITWNISNAEYYMQQEPRFGSKALYILALAISRVFKMPEPTFLNPINYDLGGYNTVPYFVEWYLDVGLFGTVLASFLWGYSVGVVQRKAAHSPSWLVIHGLLQTSILFSFRTNTVSHFDFIFMVIVATGLSTIIELWRTVCRPERLRRSLRRC